MEGAIPPSYTEGQAGAVLCLALSQADARKKCCVLVPAIPLSCCGRRSVFKLTSFPQTRTAMAVDLNNEDFVCTGRY